MIFDHPFGCLRFVPAIGLIAGLMAIVTSTYSVKADDSSSVPRSNRDVNWSGFYTGGHLGYAWGTSNWTVSGPAVVSGTMSLFQPFDAFNDTGSFFQGFQAGFNYRLPSNVIMGAEADVWFPSLRNNAGISIGGASNFNSPALGAETFSETVFSSGTIRGRLGYTPGNWLLYATGGFAWTYNQQSLTQSTTGTTESPFLWRLGLAAGAGVELPVAPHWTARLEYLLTDYGSRSSSLLAGTQRMDSNFTLQELRAGLNYQFGGVAPPANRLPILAKSPAAADFDYVNFHGQATFLQQAYPAFRSPYEGTNSLPGGGQGRETSDATLYAGVRLWKGAELWINGEIDQGFGIGDAHGIAGFTSGEAYKVGQTYPYARLPRSFVRQTIDLGGTTLHFESAANQFAGSSTTNRLVYTVGKFAVVDIFDTNKYAHDPRTDFMNWAIADTGTFDYAADAWGYTYGAAAEWYQGNWTVRGGVFDLSVVPNSTDLDPSFSQVQWVGEIERRYDLWGHPGKIAVTVFLTRGRMGTFANAIALAAINGGPADIAAVRQYQSRTGIALNMEQEITSDLGAFVRMGWADGTKEPYEFTDIDRTVVGGVSLTGKPWNRPTDTVGIAGVVNNIAGVHQAFFNAGGLGILIGDGQLPHPGVEQIIETYYSYAVTESTKVSVDYQFIANPAYNGDRGPVSVFAGRVHTQF